MTPGEIVLANIEHTPVDRCGFNFTGNPEFLNDFCEVGLGGLLNIQPKRWTEGNKEYYYDLWGNLWVRIKDGCAHGEIHTPVLKDLNNLDEIKLPDFTDSRIVGKLKKAFQQEPDKFHVAEIYRWVFAAARYLRKMEFYLMDMALAPEKLHRLHSIISDVVRQQILVAAEAGADAIMFCEDMGTQTNLLFSPAMWNQYFAKLYTELFGLVHDNGMKVIMHSCGKNDGILEPLLKAGVDCFQFDQPTIYDMPKLAELLTKYNAALYSPIDVQKVLPTGDMDLIKRAAVEMVDTFRGFLIVKNYPDLPGIGVKDEWNEWGYKCLLQANGL